MNQQTSNTTPEDNMTHSEIAASRTDRPVFTGDPKTDALWDVITALTNELGATRARLDTLERILADQNTIPGQAVDRWVPDETAAIARTHDYQAYISRVFNTLAL